MSTTPKLLFPRSKPRLGQNGRESSSKQEDGKEGNGHDSTNPHQMPWSKQAWETFGMNPTAWTAVLLFMEYWQQYYIGYGRATMRHTDNHYGWVVSTDRDTADAGAYDTDGTGDVTKENGCMALTKPYELRALILEPGERDHPVECQLAHGRLSAAPRSAEGRYAGIRSGLRPDDLFKYEALSYVWGDPSAQEEIICHGRKRKVTRNLYEALESLRYTDRRRLLWVDAVCIDQHNDKEKSGQVRMMGQIYARSSRVLVWLGGSKADEQAMEHVMKDNPAWP
jgi:hypothetical protein